MRSGSGRRSADVNWPRAKIYFGRTLMALGIVAAALNLVSFALLAMAYAKAPAIRDTSSGHIHPFSNHGFIRYLDDRGQFILDATWWLPVLAFSLLLPGYLILFGPNARRRWLTRNF